MLFDTKKNSFLRHLNNFSHFIKHEFSLRFVCQNISACLQLNRPKLVIVYFYILLVSSIYLFVHNKTATKFCILKKLETLPKFSHLVKNLLLDMGSKAMQVS